jgi:hypothetical protein
MFSLVKEGRLIAILIKAIALTFSTIELDRSRLSGMYKISERHKHGLRGLHSAKYK